LTKTLHYLSISSHDLLLQTVWNVLEFSLAAPGDCLLRGRHLDQLLLCSVYLACKLLGAPSPTFADLIRIYKTAVSTEPGIYRHVLVDGQFADLITFYNQVFVPRLRPNASAVVVRAKHQPPAPRTPTSTHHFSPVRLGLATPVFVSPGTGQLQPGSKTKLSFSFGRPRPARSLELINAMIKRNEIRLKVPSVPRPLGDLSGESAGAAPPQTTPRPVLSFLSSVVSGTRFSAANNLTMLVNAGPPSLSSSTSPAASGLSFARKLQGIQSERKP